MEGIGNRAGGGQGSLRDPLSLCEAGSGTRTSKYDVQGPTCFNGARRFPCPPPARFPIPSTRRKTRSVLHSAPCPAAPGCLLPLLWREGCPFPSCMRTWGFLPLLGKGRRMAPLSSPLRARRPSGGAYAVWYSFFISAFLLFIGYCLNSIVTSFSGLL